jgi:hypothetical protein
VGCNAFSVHSIVSGFPLSNQWASFYLANIVMIS